MIYSPHLRVYPVKGQYLLALLSALFLIVLPLVSTNAQKKKKPAGPKNEAVSELAKLREEFINKTKDYKASLEKLIVLYEQDVSRAEAKAGQARELFQQGLIARNQMDESEAAVASAKAKVTEARRSLTTADSQIANTLLEAEAQKQLAKLPIRKGSLVSTTAYIRYNGPANWNLPDAWKI